jgi:hypothetical protein
MSIHLSRVNWLLEVADFHAAINKDHAAPKLFFTECIIRETTWCSIIERLGHK